MNKPLLYLLIAGVLACGPVHANPTTPPAQPGAITLLFAYSPQAACTAGGVPALQQQVAEGLTRLNEALRNSQIGYTVQAVPQWVEVAAEAAPDREAVHALLASLGQADGPFNQVHQVRQATQADLVCLLFAGAAMGLAQQDGDMMVAHPLTFGETYGFAHEFGHCLGATHAAGMQFQIGEEPYRTLSTYGGRALPYYSQDREVLYVHQGQALRVRLGDAQHDNAATMRRQAPHLARRGEGLAPVPVAAAALSTRVVEPGTVAASPDCPPAVVIDGCHIRPDQSLVICYRGTDAVRLQAQLLDQRGEYAGGFQTLLAPDQTCFVRAYFALQPGDHYEITVGDQAYTCSLRE